MIEVKPAFAQEGGQAPPQGSPISGLMPLILIFFVFYFLLIRPQRKQMQKQQEMINSIKKGDLIVTSGGIHGKITALKGKQIELEIAANTRVIINRQAISQVLSEDVPAVTDKTNKG